MDDERARKLMKRFEEVEQLLECCKLAICDIHPDIDSVIWVLDQVLTKINSLEVDIIQNEEK